MMKSPGSDLPKRSAIFILFLFLSFGIPFSLKESRGAVNDGKILFGGSASTTTPEAYSNANGGNWSADTQSNAAEATITYVVCEASPQSPEVICALSSNSANDTLYVYRWDGSSWTQDWSDSGYADSTTRGFDVAYEQDSGDALVVYSNGGTTNELSYRKRVDDVWDGSSTTQESARTSAAISWIEMESRPSSDEIGMAFSDAAASADLSALVWNGSAWGSEHSAALSTALDRGANRDFDLAYEQSSGDLIVVYGISATSGVGIARKGAGATTWTDDNDDGVIADQCSVIDLASEPGTNNIAFSCISDASSDLTLARWDGTDDDCTACAFTNLYGNADTGTGAVTSNWMMVGNGWANGRALFAYTNAAATTLSYFTFQTTDSFFCCNNGGACGDALCGANDTPFTVSPPFTSGTKNHIGCEQFSGSPAKVMVTTVDSVSDLWTLTYDGTSNTANWATVDDGTGGDNPLEGTTTTATQMPAGASITTHDPTPVGLLSLSATSEEGGALVGWRTATEAYLSGFKLYRAPTELINTPGIPLEEVTSKGIRSKGNPLSGHSYSYQDKTLKAGQNYSYLLEVIEKDGDPIRYGPVTLNLPSTFIGRPQKEKGYLRRDGKRVQELRDGTEVIEVLKNVKHLSKARSKVRRHFAPIKIELNTDGIYRVSGAKLEAAGLNLSLIQPKRLKLFRQGQEIPIHLSGTEDGIFHPEDFLEFYGKKMTGRYTATNVYWLEQFGKAGKRIENVPSLKGGSETVSYTETVHLEQNDAYYGEITKGENRFFFEDELLSPASVTYTFPVDHLYPGGNQEATLRVALQGLQPHLTSNFSQHVILSINGQSVGEVRWDRDEPFQTEHPFPVTLLTEGENNITIVADDAVPEPPQIVLIDWIEIDYPRKLVAKNGSLAFDLPHRIEGTYSSPPLLRTLLHGFSSPSVEIFAVHLKKTLRITDFETSPDPETGYTIAFSGKFLPGTKLIAAEEGVLKDPPAMAPDELSGLRRKHNEADYLIVTHEDFEEAIEELTKYRASQGLKVKVVNVEDIYDEFNYGVFSPMAIRDFLRYVHEHWKGKPSYLLLVGDGTFDYQDFFGIGTPNFVPAYFVVSPDFGEAPSDTAYPDVDDDGVSEIAVGRLAVQDPSQVLSIINKIKAYEAGVSLGKAHFAVDAGGTFLNHSDLLAENLPDSTDVTTLSLDELPSGEVRQGLLDGINGGTDTVNYIGHGAILFLSSQDILNTSDIDSLLNTTYPLMTTSSCLSSYFVYPGNELNSLSEVFLNAEEKGIVASLGPTALSSPTEQQIFAEAFYQAMLTEKTLGEAHLSAQKILKTKGSPSRAKNVNRTFLLLGDPALRPPR